MGQNFSGPLNQIFQIFILAASVEIVQGLSHPVFLYGIIKVHLIYALIWETENVIELLYP